MFLARFVVPTATANRKLKNLCFVLKHTKPWVYTALIEMRETEIKR